MKASELIKQLEEIKQKWGDLDVEVKSSSFTYSKPWLTINKLTNSKNIIAVN